MITAQIERIERCWPELVSIFPSHHRELALFQDRMPLAPQREQYFDRGNSGAMVLATVRWNGKLVGYHIAQIQPGMHYGSTLIGTTDIYFIVPEARDRGLFLPLHRCIERELRRRGVGPFYSSHKAHNPLLMDKMFPVLGFVLSDFYWVKWLNNDHKQGDQGI